jgi:hypothetical protein
VSLGKEGIWQLLTHLERIWQDLFCALEPHCIDHFSENICIRKWINIDVDMEFRGFVKNGRLNALSQYNHLVLSKKLIAPKEEISEQIQRFFNEKINPILNEKYESYVIDFGISEDGKV